MVSEIFKSITLEIGKCILNLISILIFRPPCWKISMVLSLWLYFIPCTKTTSAFRVVRFYFDEIVKFYGLSRTIISDKDFSFMSYFRENFKHIMRTELKFSSA